MCNSLSFAGLFGSRVWALSRLARQQASAGMIRPIYGLVLAGGGVRTRLVSDDQRQPVKPCRRPLVRPSASVLRRGKVPVRAKRCSKSAPPVLRQAG